MKINVNNAPINKGWENNRIVSNKLAKIILVNMRLSIIFKAILNIN